jgi:hypothetical protein
MGKYIAGEATNGNLKGWANYSKGNSYHADKSQLRHDIGTVGAAKDLKGDWSKDWQQPQKSQEGQGWAKINPAGSGEYLHQQGRYATSNNAWRSNCRMSLGWKVCEAA